MTKEELEKYGWLRVAHEVLAKEMEQLEEDMDGAGFCREHRHRLAAKKEALLMDFLLKEEALVDRMYAIEKAIEVLDETEQTVLRMVYLLGMTEEEAANELPCDVRTLQRIKKRALDKVCSEI